MTKSAPVSAAAAGDGTDEKNEHIYGTFDDIEDFDAAISISATHGRREKGLSASAAAHCWVADHRDTCTSERTNFEREKAQECEDNAPSRWQRFTTTLKSRKVWLDGLAISLGQGVGLFVFDLCRNATGSFVLNLFLGALAYFLAFFAVASLSTVSFVLMRWLPPEKKAEVVEEDIEMQQVLGEEIVMQDRRDGGE